MPAAKTLFFTAPKCVEVHEAALPSLKADEVLVQNICSAISAGTELLVYCGQFPQLKDANDSLSSELKYPLTYGYASVGQVIELGKEVNREWEHKFVFSFRPHCSHFISNVDSLIPIPASFSAETACFLPNMETAVNLIQDGAPILGERVLVLGQGMVGLLTASLLTEFPLENLTVVDSIERRRNAMKSKINKLAPDDLGLSTFDLTFELTGSPTALNTAIEHTIFSGRIVIGSWYGQKRAEIDLGGSFHRSRIKLISSQVSTISPELSGRWDKPRRFDVAWKALERIQPQKWITHRFSIDEAEKAYRLLDEHPQEAIQILFQY